MKKEYMKPAMRAVKIQQCSIICVSGGNSIVKSVHSSFDDPNDDFIYGGGGTEMGR